MEKFMPALSVVFPLTVYMAAGSMIRKVKIFTAAQFQDLNIVIFRIFLPLALFFDIYDADMGNTLSAGFILFVTGGILAGYALLWAAVPKLVQKKSDATTIIQGIYRSNFVLFGTYMAGVLCSSKGRAVVSALAAVVVPLFNILAVILFEIRRGGSISAAKIILNIFKNPLVDAGILGCLCSLLHMQFPVLLAEPLRVMGDLASPLAFIALGGMLSFHNMKKQWKYLVLTAAGRLVIYPRIMLSAAVCLGYRGDLLAAVLAVFASPTAVASVPMAQALDGNGILAGEIVAVTSVCSIFTIFLFILGISV